MYDNGGLAQTGAGLTLFGQQFGLIWLVVVGLLLLTGGVAIIRLARRGRR